MISKSNMFWTVYKKLEKDVVNLSYYIHFSDEEDEKKKSQLWTYSNQIADLLIAINTQIESLFLELYKIEFKKDAESIGTAINELDKRWNLSSKKVSIISKNMYFKDADALGNEFAPMAYKSHDENDYYGAYCAVKHNRINVLYKANINVLIRALAGLFILNVYYSFESVEIDDIFELDFSLGSDVFMVKYSINGYSQHDILIVSEDAEYLKKISMYADAIPELDSTEFLNFKDKTPEPKRYTVKINRM